VEPSVRRLLSAIVTSLVLAFGLGACGSGESPDASPRVSPVESPTVSPEDTPSPAPSAGPSLAADLPGVPVPEAVEDFEPFTGPASDEFGADSVMDAYLGATQLLMRTTFDPEAVMADVPPERLTDALGLAMTPKARGLWNEKVQAVRAMTATEQQFEDVFSLVTWSVLHATDEHVPGVQPREPRVRDFGYGGGRTAVVTDGGLALDMRFPVKGQVLTRSPAGQPYRTEVRKDVALTMTRDASGRWFIDGWKVDREVDKPVLDDVQ
jgi:hypothetical protein